MNDITLQISPPVTNEQLSRLFAAAWEGHVEADFQPILQRSLLYVCAVHEDEIIGFVNVAWDGGIHAFLLDTTVDPRYQRHGVGLQLVQGAIGATRERGVQWLHVDYEPHLRVFYEKCGFRDTEAGLIDLT